MSILEWHKKLKPSSNTRNAKIIHKIYSTILTWIYVTEYRGGCHDTSAAMYILLKESGVDCSLCIGEVATGELFFDHSWIEISGKVYDAAACMPLVGGVINSPVFCSMDLHSGTETELVYGISSPVGLDQIGKLVADIDLYSYSTLHEDNSNRLWDLTKELGKLAGINVNIGKIKSSYGAIRREFRG
ncbi:lasso peptide biosynthesis protein [Aeromonas dhakensis]|uniref:lasso peptide biosynthesis protein n=1 Tax=Aeromonas dhakensis TaxID=196024 RepID=UPI003BA21829